MRTKNIYLNVLGVFIGIFGYPVFVIVKFLVWLMIFLFRIGSNGIWVPNFHELFIQIRPFTFMDWLEFTLAHA